MSRFDSWPRIQEFSFKVYVDRWGVRDVELCEGATPDEHANAREAARTNRSCHTIRYMRIEPEPIL
jgi:hypothetical protein